MKKVQYSTVYWWFRVQTPIYASFELSISVFTLVMVNSWLHFTFQMNSWLHPHTFDLSSIMHRCLGKVSSQMAPVSDKCLGSLSEYGWIATACTVWGILNRIFLIEIRFLMNPAILQYFFNVVKTQIFCYCSLPVTSVPRSPHLLKACLSFLINSIISAHAWIERTALKNSTRRNLKCYHNISWVGQLEKIFIDEMKNFHY